MGPSIKVIIIRIQFILSLIILIFLKGLSIPMIISKFFIMNFLFKIIFVKNFCNFYFIIFVNYLLIIFYNSFINDFNDFYY